MFTSNNPDALHIDINDRRMCVIEFAGSKLPKEFFDDFLNWRDERGGTSALLHHLLHLPLAGFSPTAEAPRTRAKDEMMDATYPRTCTNGAVTIAGAIHEPAESMVLGATDAKRSPKRSTPTSMSASRSRRGS